jgi:luciferase family oxidoreductase group 1
MPTLSVLEQAPIREGVEPARSIRDALALARHVESLGYHRFWIAEHHAIGGVASSAPEVLIGHVASVTGSIRVGSGGMLLPNHRPLHVAEQFLTLEALHPGRIDLGLGRSEGSLDEAIVRALGRPEGSAHGDGYDAQIDQLLAFAGLARLPDGDPFAGVRAGPAGVPVPPVYMLGSSLDSARAAARRGLPYAFAAYTNPDIAHEALRLYRKRFTPARPGDRPYAILGLKVVVGDDDEHARALALPWYVSWVRTRAGTASGGLMPVERALDYRFSAPEREAEHRVRTDADIVAGPERAAARLHQQLERSGADEVIVTTNTFAFEDRLASYERLAEAAGLVEAQASQSVA